MPTAALRVLFALLCFLPAGVVSAAVNTGVLPAGSVRISGVIGDSILQWSDHQGSNNWSYGYAKLGADEQYSTDKFTPFNNYNRDGVNTTLYRLTDVWSVGALRIPEMSRFGSTPFLEKKPGVGLTSYVTVRRFVTDTAGHLRIDGVVTAPAGLGTNQIAILVDGEIKQQFFAGYDDHIPFSIAVEVAHGSQIDFLTYPPVASANYKPDEIQFWCSLVNLDAPQNGVIADSAQDWSTNGIQGVNGWTNGVILGRSFDLSAFLPANSLKSRTVWDPLAEEFHATNGTTPWFRIQRYFTHPTTDLMAALPIRQWVSDRTGDLVGEFVIASHQAQNREGTGVTGLIYHNNTLVASGVAQHGDPNPTQVLAQFHNVKKGDRLSFVMSCNYLFDETEQYDWSIAQARVFGDTKTNINILKQPVGYSAPVGIAASIPVYAFGPGLTFQWSKNGVDIVGSTNPTLSLASMSLKDEGFYSLRITDLSGDTFRSDSVFLRGVEKPLFTTKPKGGRVLQYEEFDFDISVSGTPPFSVRLLRSEREVYKSIEATNRFILRDTITAPTPLNNTYRIVVTNEAGLATAQATISILLDKDRDGLPDSWETQYGLNPNNTSDSTLDSDGDGVSNRDEYLAGTDPTNKTSVLRIEQFLQRVDGFHIGFTAHSNRVYGVQGSGDLQSWKTVITLDAALGDQRREALIAPISNLPSFFRLIASPAR